VVSRRNYNKPENLLLMCPELKKFDKHNRRDCFDHTRE